MKTKKSTLAVFILIGFVLLVSAALVNTPNRSQAVAQGCQADPMRCVVPQSVSDFW